MVMTNAATSPAESQRERDNREVSYRAALEGIVLLENDGTLPLAPGKVALYGAGGRHTVKGGTGSGEVNERRRISIESGLEAAGFQVTTKSWLDDYDADFEAGKAAYGERIRQKFRRPGGNAIIEVFSNPYRYPAGRPITSDDIADSQTDTCVFVIARQAGEGGDRKLDQDDFNLSHVERDNLRRCCEAYAKVVVVLNVGASFDTSFVREIPGIRALLYICQLGSEGGRAFAEVLRGAVSPSGKLTDSWARSYYDLPFANEFGALNGDLANEVYREGIYVGYRYFDAFNVQPAYAFGFGLSYTTFEISPGEVVIDGAGATVRTSVTNTGTSHGKQVVQVYVSSPQTGIPKEKQALAGFAKTEVLQPGGSTQLMITVDLALLGSYDQERSAFVLDPGDYVVRLGDSSRSTTPTAVLTLDSQVMLSTHQPICTPEIPIKELAAPAQATASEDLSEIPRHVLDPRAFATVAHEYVDPPVLRDPAVEALLDKLSVEEQATLVNGVGTLYIVRGSGTTAFATPGATGSTTDALVAKGIPNVILADGPAGLRLQQHSVLTKKGILKPVGAPVEIMKYLPSPAQRILQGDPNKGESRYQFTTAFPVETALAQTWNEAIMGEVGAAVAAEMAEYGVTFWLAPGINIHRNPLCGRNFEYYSEDPFLSGKLCASLVRGVQAVDGCFVTLKHYVANEAEENRNRSNSQVNERALREIYLRPFEIAVKEAQAKAVMTSYNLVNGVYTPNSHDLNTKVLRNEWGFSGLVVTDWGATGKELADTATCLKAGNDLLMPGGKAERKKVLQGLRDAVITETDLRRCAANVLQAILNSRRAK